MLTLAEEAKFARSKDRVRAQALLKAEHSIPRQGCREAQGLTSHYCEEVRAFQCYHKMVLSSVFPSYHESSRLSKTEVISNRRKIYSTQHDTSNASSSKEVLVKTEGKGRTSTEAPLHFQTNPCVKHSLMVTSLKRGVCTDKQSLFIGSHFIA